MWVHTFASANIYGEKSLTLYCGILRDSTLRIPADRTCWHAWLVAMWICLASMASQLRDRSQKPYSRQRSIDSYVLSPRYGLRTCSITARQNKIRVQGYRYRETSTAAACSCSRGHLDVTICGIHWMRKPRCAECYRHLSFFSSIFPDRYQFLLLDQLAYIRATLFRYNLPVDFATRYLHDRIFGFKPDSFDLSPTPTRRFWVHVLESKIQATIREEGDMIGWEDDEETVGPVALKAKHSLLRAVPLIMPKGRSEASEASLYRHVLEHGDFGIHNISITGDTDGNPFVTSVYDWETACIVPAILSDPLVAASPVDLVANEEGVSCVTRIPNNSTATEMKDYAGWAHHYVEV